MGWTIGLPSLKLNNTGTKSKHCGSFEAVAAEALEERKGWDSDIDADKSHLNIYEGFKTAADLKNYSDEHVAQMRDSKGRKMRKDAVVMCATLIKPPAAFMATLSREDQKRFLDDGRECLENIIGPDNVKSVAYHFDELGSHLHVFWEPITPDGRLCAKEVHNLQFFGRVNRDMPAFLRNRGWDIDDCHSYDQAEEALKTEQEKAERRQKNGRSSAAFKLEAAKELENLKSQIHAAEEKMLIIRSYDEYLQAADVIDEDLSLAEEITAELPSAAKMFQASAAQRWTERMLSLLQKVSNGIAAGIQRLKLFELTHEVPEVRSEPAEKRVQSLDSLISGALARTPGQSGGKSKSKERDDSKDSR